MPIEQLHVQDIDCDTGRASCSSVDIIFTMCLAAHPITPQRSVTSGIRETSNKNRKANAQFPSIHMTLSERYPDVHVLRDRVDRGSFYYPQETLPTHTAHRAPVSGRVPRFLLPPPQYNGTCIEAFHAPPSSCRSCETHMLASLNWRHRG